MAYDIGIKLKLDGEKEYRDAISNITNVNKTLDAELKAVTSSFDKNTSAEEKKRKTEKILQEQLDNSKRKLDEVSKGLADATAHYSADSKEVLSWRQAYAKAETEVNNITKQINNLGNEMDETGGKSSDFKTIFARNLSADAVMGAIKGVANGIKQIATELVNATKEARKFADDIRTMSAQMGISVETLQEFKYMEDLVDVSAQTLASGFKKITSAMKSATKGSGDAYDTFAELGVSIYDANGELRNSSDVFMDVIDGLGKIENETQRDIVATTLLGKSATDFNTIIAIGSEGMREFRQEAHDMGYVLDEESINSLVGVSDQMARMDNAMTMAKNTIGLALAPVVIGLCDAVIYLSQGVGYVIENWKEFGRECSNLYHMIVDAIGQIPSAIDHLVEVVTEAFSNLIKKAGAWGSDMMQGFINGIKAKIESLKAAMSTVTSTIASRIHFSRPDVGELRNYEQWMPDFMQGLAKGIKQNSYLVTDAMQNLTDGMQINLNKGVTGGATVVLESVVFNGYNEQQGEAFVNDLNRRLGRIYR